jgi:hypothetical protein
MLYHFGTDFDHLGTVNTSDFRILAEHWLAGAE